MNVAGGAVRNRRCRGRGSHAPVASVAKPPSAEKAPSCVAACSSQRREFIREAERYMRAGAVLASQSARLVGTLGGTPVARLPANVRQRSEMFYMMFCHAMSVVLNERR